MFSILEKQGWAIKVPSSWGLLSPETDDESNTITLISESSDDSALNITAFYAKDVLSLPHMQEHMQMPSNTGGTVQQVTLGDFAGYNTSFARAEDDGDKVAWRIWCLYCRNVHLYITFNCTATCTGIEDSAVDEMLRTAMCLIEDND